MKLKQKTHTQITQNINFVCNVQRNNIFNVFIGR